LLPIVGFRLRWAGLPFAKQTCAEWSEPSAQVVLHMALARGGGTMNLPLVTANPAMPEMV